MQLNLYLFSMCLFMNELERIKLAIAYIQVNENIKQKDVAIAFGYKDQSSFSRILIGASPIPKDMVNKLAELYPYLNKEWLISGKGSLLDKSNLVTEKEIEENKTVDELLEIIKIQSSNETKLIEADLIRANNEFLREKNQEINNRNIERLIDFITKKNN